MCLSPDVRLRRCLSPRRAALSIYPSFFQVCFFLRKQPLCPSLSVSVCTASLRCVEASGSSRVRRYAISIFVSLGYVCVCRCIVFHLSVCLLVHLVSLPFLSFFFLLSCPCPGRCEVWFYPRRLTVNEAEGSGQRITTTKKKKKGKEVTVYIYIF